MKMSAYDRSSRLEMMITTDFVFLRSLLFRGATFLQAFRFFLKDDRELQPSSAFLGVKPFLRFCVKHGGVRAVCPKKCNRSDHPIAMPAQIKLIIGIYAKAPLEFILKV